MSSCGVTHAVRACAAALPFRDAQAVSSADAAVSLPDNSLVWSARRAKRQRYRRRRRARESRLLSYQHFARWLPKSARRHAFRPTRVTLYSLFCAISSSRKARRQRRSGVAIKGWKEQMGKLQIGGGRASPVNSEADADAELHLASADGSIDDECIPDGSSQDSSNLSDELTGAADTDILRGVVVGQSLKHSGMGCIATACLPRGAVMILNLSQASAHAQPSDQIPVWPQTVLEVTQLGPVFQHLNHSCFPNCQLRLEAGGLTCELRIVRHIQVGDELTVDYSVHGLFPPVFQCKCGCTPLRPYCWTSTSAPRPLPTTWTPVLKWLGFQSLGTIPRPPDPQPSLRKLSLLFRARHGATDHVTRDSLCAGNLDLNCPFAEAETLDEILGPLRTSNTCVTSALMNTWLYVLSHTHGFAFERFQGWDPNSQVWIASTHLFSTLVAGGYDLPQILRRLDVGSLTAMDGNGRFVKRKLIFPVFVPAAPGERGHWYYICLKPHAKRIEVGDSLGAARTPEAQIIARLWNDLCILEHGYHFGAETWPVKRVDVGMQEENWECGFYTLAGISGECANRRDRLRNAEIDSIRRLLAMDLVHGAIVDNGARIRRAPRETQQPLDGRMPEGSPANVRAPGGRAHCRHSWGGAAGQPPPPAGAPFSTASPPDSVTSRRGSPHVAGRDMTSRTSPPAADSDPMEGDASATRREVIGQHLHDTWDGSGNRIRRPDIRGLRRPRTRRRARRPTPQALPSKVDSPEVDSVPLGGEEGIPLQMLSLNLGISGFKGSLRTGLREFLGPRDIAVVHLQEARIKAHELVTWRKRALDALPKYALYAHCYSGHRNTAVITLVRKEIAKWCSPLNTDHAGDALSGRLIALRYAPPNITQPLVLANVWMPHSGYSSESIQAAHEAFSELAARWKREGYAVLASGDWNATADDSQRSAPARNPVPDVAFRRMLDTTGLVIPSQVLEPTWYSSDGSTTATLDHILVTDRAVVSTFALEQVTSSDHLALLCTLPEDIGCWNTGQHVPVIRQDRLNFADLDNLTPLFCAELEGVRDQCTDLASLERCMWTTAKDVFGLQKAAGGKPYVNKTVLALRKAIRVAKRLLRWYSRPDEVSDPPREQWQDLHDRLLRAQCVAKADSMFGHDAPQWQLMSHTSLKSALRQCIRDLRGDIRREMRSMDKASLAANITRCRNHLETGKRGVQRAMGKGVADARMSEVETSHPSVVLAFLDYQTENWIETVCKAVVQECSFHAFTTNEGTRALRCTPQRLHDVATLLRVLEREQVRTAIASPKRLVDDPSDVLSALEHFMGTEGKARGMLCTGCRSPELMCLSQLTGEGRELCWYCSSCQRCCEYEEDPSVYDDVPWSAECVTDFNRVPEVQPSPAAYRLRGRIEWDDFLRHLRCMSNRKAPGDDLVPAELWKKAPEWAQRLLFDTINEVLEGKRDMPDHWRGGTVQFLFKKPPSTLLSNWRPICLLNVSYRLYSSIVTDRLNRLVEAYGILDQAQEAFRFQHGTRRQIETLLNLIRAARIQNKSLVVALLDFRNAFNSNDVRACMRILQAYNIPDLDLIEDMYKNAYYRARTSTGLFTASVRLTRGTKQGDPLSPLIFNLTINMLVRMLLKSGYGFECLLNKGELRLRERLRSNARLFADDTALVTQSVHGASIQMSHVDQFCAYTNAEVRPDKCEVAGMDENGKAIDVSCIRYRGTPLPVWRHGTATKYLGVYMSMDLNWSTEKKYVRTKMLKAVEQLKNTCYTRAQKMMLFNMCVVPVFRYSAPLVPWTWAELRDIDKLWSRAAKYALRLPLSFDLAPILLGAESGGMGLEPAANYLLKETQLHVRQCFAHYDDVRTWASHITYEVMRLLGMTKEADVRLTGDSRLVTALLSFSPVFRLHALLRHTFWGETGSFEVEHRSDSPLARVARSWRELRTGQSLVPELFPSGITVQTERILDKVMIAFHKAQVYTVKDLIPPAGWGLREHKHLPALVRSAIAPREYATFCQHLMGLPWMRKQVNSRKPSITQAFQLGALMQEPHLGRDAAPAEDPASFLRIEKQAFEELEGLHWDVEDFNDLEEAQQADIELDAYLCREFAQGDLAWARVVAQTHPAQPPLLYRVVHHDGDAEDLSYEELVDAQALYSTQMAHPDCESRLLETAARGREWKRRAEMQLKSRNDKLWASLAGITTMVHVPSDLEDPCDWADVCYRCVRTDRAHNPVHMRKQILLGDRLQDDPTSPATAWPSDRPLGSFTGVQLDASSHVLAGERHRLDMWMQEAFARHVRRPVEAATTSANRNLITSYFAVSRQPKAAPVPLQLSYSPERHPPAPEWSGHEYSAPVRFDWQAMQPEVDVAQPYLRVTRRGRWTFYKAEEDWTSTMTSGVFTTSKHKEVKARYSNLGELDTRVGTGVLALAHPAPPWTALLGYLTPSDPVGSQQPSKPARKPKHLHWLFTEHLRGLIAATQSVGAPPTAASFGLSRIVYHSPNPPLVFDEPVRAASVIWLNGVKAVKRGTLLRALGNQHPILMVVSSRARAALQKVWKTPAGWKKVASFPAQSRLMLSTNQFDFTPKASSQILEVWANPPARARPGISDIGSFTMPDDPLRALDSLKNGRWGDFHSGAQDFPYRQAPGIVAATDGAVKKYGKEGVLMSGGIAYRAGAHGLVDTGIHVDGPISSLVAEGAALLYLLEKAPHDEPLTVLTDSANIMWAMLHCTRKERVIDFSTHPNQDMLQRLRQEHIKRTAETQYVKVTAHTSIFLNECADSLAATARADKDAPKCSFGLWEHPYCLYFFSKGEDGEHARATATELRTHFIQLRSKDVLRNRTRTVNKLTAPGVGRHLLHAVLWAKGPFSVADGVTKRMLQCISNTYPTRSRLHMMGKARSAKCPFCGADRETLGHWQQVCPQFHDARTKVHDDVWSAVYGVIRSLLPEGKFTTYKETIVAKGPFDIPREYERLKSRKPDGVYVQNDLRYRTIVDFTRVSGNTRAALRRAEERKRRIYADLLTAIRVNHAYVEFFPLVASYNGAIAENTWRAFLDRLGLDEKAQNKVLYTVAHSLCVGFNTMVDIRLSSFAHQAVLDRPRPAVVP